MWAASIKLVGEYLQTFFTIPAIVQSYSCFGLKLTSAHALVSWAFRKFSRSTFGKLSATSYVISTLFYVIAVSKMSVLEHFSNSAF